MQLKKVNKLSDYLDLKEIERESLLLLFFFFIKIALFINCS